MCFVLVFNQNFFVITIGKCHIQSWLYCLLRAKLTLKKQLFKSLVLLEKVWYIDLKCENLFSYCVLVVASMSSRMCAEWFSVWEWYMSVELSSWNNLLFIFMLEHINSSCQLFVFIKGILYCDMLVLFCFLSYASLLMSPHHHTRQ